MSYRVDAPVASTRARPDAKSRNPGRVLPVTKERVYYVMTRIGGGWSVRKEGASRPTGTFKLKSEAIKCAREVARSGGGEVSIHREDGMVQKLTTYPAPRASASAKRR